MALQEAQQRLETLAPLDVPGHGTDHAWAVRPSTRGGLEVPVEPSQAALHFGGDRPIERITGQGPTWAITGEP
jgi:hypothetical protein